MIIDLLVQMYMLTSEYAEKEVEDLYDTFEEVLQNNGKVETYAVMTGD